MKHVCLIPARANSHRLPNKHMQDLGGKPLIQWTIECAQASKAFDLIEVNSDSTDILMQAHVLGVETYLRPAFLAKADTPSIAVVREFAGRVQAEQVYLLQPTSPFRTPADIHSCLGIMTYGEGVVSVVEAPGDLAFQLGYHKQLRHISNAYVANGAIYGLRHDNIMRGDDWYSCISYGYVMPRERSIDIDTQLDLDIARMMLKREDVA